jgi:predicted phosphodiesterase
MAWRLQKEHTMRRLFALGVALVAAMGWTFAQNVQLPDRPGSLKFAVLGDNGTGSTQQYDLGRQMAGSRAQFAFDFVIMLGDNMYGRQEPQDFVDKFQRPYASLLDAGVRFYATLGNHDKPDNRNYPGFNMGGERYYTYAKKNVRFFVLDSNLMDPTQLAWFEAALAGATDRWKIVYFHHPLYSDAGRHGPDVALRVALEPLLIEHGVDVVFSGHEHVYERLKPQKGITYFTAGSGGQLRKGDVQWSDMTAAAFDQDQAFMLVEVGDEELSFQAISRTGRTVDSGVLHRRPKS